MQYQYQVAPPAPPAAAPAFAERFRESSWYTRIDYFHWNERLDDADFVNEYGTPVTYERVVDFDTTLYPQIGLTGQLEAGNRGRRFVLSGCFESMGWNQSDVVRDSLQPASSFTTAGFKAGYCF